MKYTKINDKLQWKFVDPKFPYVRCKVINRFGELVEIDYNAYIFGLVGMQKFKKNNEDHSLILITGLPGSGKSTFVEGIAGLDSSFMGEKLEMSDLAWSMDNLISLMDSPDNKNRAIWADEFIQGSGRFNQSNIGIKLKIGFITKRFKRNTYYIVLDEIKECPEKIIKMVDAYINIKKIGFNRGYYDCWTNKDKIYNLWDNFKNYSNNWKSPWIRKIKPDNKGKFNNYRGVFLDSDKFDELKFEQTKQSEKETDKTININALKAYKLKIENPKMSNNKIAQELNVNHSTIGEWLRKIDKVVVDVQ